MGLAVTPVDPNLPTVAAAPSSAATAYDPAAGREAELDRQLDAYAELGVAAVAGLDRTTLAGRVAPLREALRALPDDAGSRATIGDDGVAFVLVLPGLDLNDVAPAMRRGPRLGVSVIGRDEMRTYRPVDGVDAPDAPYLLWGIDTGSELCGVRPEEALVTVRSRGRAPLTAEEGVALTVVRPDVLRPNRCYSLMGSRTGTNQRVPAVWISQRRAKLGWCWDRNPHTWLGAASAAGRVGE